MIFVSMGTGRWAFLDGTGGTAGKVDFGLDGTGFVPVRSPQFIRLGAVAEAVQLGQSGASSVGDVKRASVSIDPALLA